MTDEDDHMEFIERYFPQVSEYPDPVSVMMEPGTLLSYISIPYLNGWINYVTIASAFLGTRYRRHRTNRTDAAAFNAGDFFHADLGQLLKDDVVILARAKHRSDEWWFFHADRDSSDCDVGRFRTDDAPDQVRALFERYAQDCSEESSECGNDEDPEDSAKPLENPAPALPLDPKAFKGWITL